MEAARCGRGRLARGFWLMTRGLRGRVARDHTAADKPASSSLYLILQAFSGEWPEGIVYND